MNPRRVEEKYGLVPISKRREGVADEPNDPRAHDVVVPRALPSPQHNVRRACGTQCCHPTSLERCLVSENNLRQERLYLSLVTDHSDVRQAATARSATDTLPQDSLLGDKNVPSSTTLEEADGRLIEV